MFLFTGVTEEPLMLVAGSENSYQWQWQYNVAKSKFLKHEILMEQDINSNKKLTFTNLKAKSPETK